MPAKTIRSILLFLAVTTTAAGASAQSSLTDLMNKARPGETVEIPSGRYEITDMKLRKNVHLRGDGDVVFFSSAPVAKGLLNPMPGVSIIVENITFEGARSPDLNGAGIRHDGRDLIVVNCAFIDNEDGILFTGDEDGSITIDGSTFIGNGHGDGYSHAIYINRAARLDVIESRFSGTRIGHHIKSLASQTTVVGSSFDDTGGRTSYALDASGGGDVIFRRNAVVKSADADNSAIINYDLTRGGKPGRIEIVNNRILNRHPDARLLRNASSATPLIAENDIMNEPGARLRMDGN